MLVIKYNGSSNKYEACTLEREDFLYGSMAVKTRRADEVDERESPRPYEAFNPISSSSSMGSPIVAVLIRFGSMI